MTKTRAKELTPAQVKAMDERERRVSRENSENLMKASQEEHPEQVAMSLHDTPAKQAKAETKATEAKAETKADEKEE